jgi:hypothetical protein
MAILNLLAELEAKVLLNDQGASKFIRALLKTVELGGENGESLVGGIADKEPEVDQVVGVRQLGDQLEVLGEISRGILEGSEDENSFVVVESIWCRLDGV